MPRLVDISMYLENDVPSDPPVARPRLEYLDHSQTIDRIRSFFPGLRRDELPDSAGWALEKVEITTHNGTHMDAPYHFHPTMDHALGRPKRSLTIDEIPLEWCWQPGVKLDLRHMPDGHVATAADVEAELRRIGHELAPLEIVLVNTRAGAMYGSPNYIDAGCGMGRDATLYLLERGVRVTGIDGWSWDAPFSYTQRRYAQNRDPGIIWEGHKAGRDIGYCHLEKLHNLEVLPADGFRVSCFPVKVRNGSAGWTRAVAILDD